MVRHGVAPFLECSTAGDRRFSAYCARIKARGGASIEELYQAAKVFRNGDTGLSIEEARGFRPVNLKECRELYATLWDEYISENLPLIPVLLAQSGLQDRFGRKGGQCQATELWRIRAAHLPKDAS
jgi:hypothetical protein